MTAPGPELPLGNPPFQRPRDLSRLREEDPWDLLVVGGGITGAAVARLAAAQGHSVALVEREDFGSGTSGASSKMLHGGLRYLAHGQVRLVREALRERAKVVRSLPPPRVRVVPFLLPLSGSFLDRIAQRAGTWVYQRWGHAAGLGPREVLSPSEARRACPLLEPSGLRGAILYREAITDDALLTLQRVREAVAWGAVAVNHVEALSPTWSHGRISGAVLRDRLEGTQFPVKARQIVNATGAWGLRWLPGIRAAPLRPSKGIHLVFRRSRFPLDVAVVIPTRDRRWVFALPYGRFVILGTTDEDFTGDPDRVEPTRSEGEGLLRLANDSFPALRLSPMDVCDAYAGLRPLVQDDRSRPGDTSREDSVSVDPRGVVTVAGGKLTTHLAMARRALRGWERGSEAREDPPERTAFPWKGPWGDEYSAGDLLAQLADMAPSQRRASLRPWIRWAVEEAGALTLVDVVERRLRPMNRNEPSFPLLVDEVVRCLVEDFHWSEGSLRTQRDDYLERLRKGRAIWTQGAP